MKGTESNFPTSLINFQHLAKALALFATTIGVNLWMSNLGAFAQASELSQTNKSKRELAEDQQSSQIINYNQIAQLPIAGTPKDIKIQNNYAFVISEPALLQIINIANVNAPRIEFNYTALTELYAVELFNNHAYLAAGLDGLLILDVVNPANPKKVGAHYTGWSVTKLSVNNNKAFLVDDSDDRNVAIIDVSKPNELVINRVSVADNAGFVTVNNNIAYVMSYSGIFNSLQIFNVSDPLNPTFLGNCSTLNTVVSISTGIVKVKGSLAYVGIRTAGLQIIDVNNPAKPQVLGNFSFQATEYLNDLSVEGNFVYLAISHSNAVVGGLQIIDVTTPSNPQLIKQYSTGQAFGIIVKNSIAYIYSQKSGISVFNVSDPMNSQLMRNYTLSAGSAALSVVSDTLYVAVIVSSSVDDKGLFILNVSIPANPQLISNYKTLSNQAHDVDVSNKIAYVANANSVQLIDVSNPAQPQFIRSYGIPGPVSGTQTNQLCVRGKMLYIPAGLNGLIIIDTTFPHKNLFNDFSYTSKSYIADFMSDGTGLFTVNAGYALTLNWFDTQDLSIATIKTFDAARDISWQDNLAYVATDSGLEIFNVSNSISPQFLGRCVTSIKGAAISVSGSHAYIVGDSGMQIIDISNPMNPRFLSNYTVVGRTMTCVVSRENIAYVGVNYGFCIINTSDPIDPKLIAAYYDYGTSDISINNDIIYLTNTEGLTIVDVIDPRQPRLLGNYASRGFAEAIFVNGHSGYLSNYDLDNYWFEILDLSNPANPIRSGSYRSESNDIMTSITLSNTIAYAFDDYFIQLLDVSDPTKPSPIGQYYSLCNPQSITSSGNLLLVADEHCGLRVITNSSLRDSYLRLNVLPRKLTIANNYSYVTDADRKLHIIDVQDKLNLTEVSANFQLLGNVRVMKAADDFLYIAEGNFGVEVVDVYNPSSAKLATRLNLTDSRALAFTNNQLYVLDAQQGLLIYEILGQTLLANHDFTLSPGANFIVTSNQLSARDTNVAADVQQLQFIISNMQNAQFEFVSQPGVAITTFSQQNISDGQLRFINTADAPPSFLISVSNGVTTTSAQNAIIIFQTDNTPPQILNNSLIINEGQSVVFSLNELSATDKETALAQLRFIPNNIKYGRFESVKRPGVFITNFLQQDIINRVIQFVHTGGSYDEPSYEMVVNDGQLDSGISIPIVDFNAAPKLITNQLTISIGATVTLSANELQAIDADDANSTLLLIITDVQYGTLNKQNFTQQELTDGNVQFTHDGSPDTPSYFVSVADKRMQITPQKAITSLGDQNNTIIIASSVAGGVALLSTAVGVGFWVRKKQVDKHSREQHALAQYVRRHLQLQGVDNFESEAGKRFTTAVQKLISALVQQGLTISNMSSYELEQLGSQVAESAKNKISPNTTCSGKSIISVWDFENKINEIAQDVALNRSSAYLPSSSSDTHIEMRNFQQ